jgi:hypothetical protein
MIVALAVAVAVEVCCAFAAKEEATTKVKAATKDFTFFISLCFLLFGYFVLFVRLMMQYYNGGLHAL